MLLKKKKCFFATLSVEYLGHRINQDSIHPTDEKVRVIEGVPSPTNITELCSFLGLIKYYGKFPSQLSTVVVPLYTLPMKGASWS